MRAWASGALYEYLSDGFGYLMPDLLPPNKTTVESALAIACAEIDNLSPTALRTLWNPDTCPLAVLPWLAWALSVDEFSSAWPEERQRNTVKESLILHKSKGTPYSIKRMLSLMGYGNVTLVEGIPTYQKYDSTYQHDAEIKYDGGNAYEWAIYDVILNAPAPDDPTLEKIIGRLNRLAPARCHLRDITEN